MDHVVGNFIVVAEPENTPDPAVPEMAITDSRAIDKNNGKCKLKTPITNVPNLCGVFDQQTGSKARDIHGKDAKVNPFDRHFCFLQTFVRTTTANMTLKNGDTYVCKKTGVRMFPCGLVLDGCKEVRPTIDQCCECWARQAELDSVGERIKTVAIASTCMDVYKGRD
jgi:hypothetical protein